ncbi:ABC transporter ATP-binding protein [Helicobacter sp. MIT 14-3879]|uniref:ABC transporter ATP-binding protein n=1 Tax=Helicobacter sp. MIT 14-3879 TaxID=2040649 RepID=UPI000E1E52D7|nr:ABC transporter ATP-binding protein [Helicobacter sp. MIT 14-3879]RDU61642.1 ABC transporter ATP-binding protein [Helicobacter sp. MIT 14-3879]
MSPLLEVTNLSKNFSTINALNNVSFNINSGEVVGLLGPNGSGKTTLIKIIVGLINNYEGEVILLGDKINIESKAKIAYLPDVNFITDSWSVNKCIGYFVDFFDDFDKHKAISLLKDCNISLDYKFKSLSKGTKEKLQLILILSRKAELYIFDEPIAGVDPVARDIIFNLILENYSKDASIIISTHLIFSVQNILSSAIFLKYGEIIANDSIVNLKNRFNNDNLEEIFKELF